MRHFLCSITRKYTYMHGTGWDLLSTCVMSLEVVGSWEPCSLTPFPSFRHLKMSPKFHLPHLSVFGYTFQPNHEISSSFSSFFFRRHCCSRHYIRRPFLTKYLDVHFDLFDEKKCQDLRALVRFQKKQFARFARHFCRLPAIFTISTGLTCVQRKNLKMLVLKAKWQKENCEKQAGDICDQ